MKVKALYWFKRRVSCSGSSVTADSAHDGTKLDTSTKKLTSQICPSPTKQ